MKSSKKKQIKPQESESREVEVVPRRDAPTADREIETLLEQARKHLDEAKRLRGESFALGRRSVREFYEAGRVLATIREKLKPTHHSWVAWQEENDLSRNRVNLAIRLFEAVRDPADLEEFKAIRQALRHYGIEKEPAVEPPADPPQKRDAGADTTVGHEGGGSQDQPPATKNEKRLPAPPQGTPVPFLKGTVRIERSGSQESFVIDAAEEIRSHLLKATSRTVRVVPRWRSELKLAVDGGDAVLIMPGLEVPDVAAG